MMAMRNEFWNDTPSLSGVSRLIIIVLMAVWTTSINHLFADGKSGTGINYSFANQQIVTVGSNSYYDFDVMASADQGGNRLGTGILLLNYNHEVFGNNVYGNSNVTVSRGSLLLTNPYPFYGLIINDNSPSRLAITFEYLFIAGFGNIVTEGPQQLVHIRMKLQNRGHMVNLGFAEGLMAYQQYMDNNQTLFYPVVCTDTDDTYLPLSPSGLTLSFQSGSLLLQWQPQIHCTYSVFSTSDIGSDVWQVEATGLTQNTWSTIPNVRTRFYRIVAESTMGN